MGITAVSSPQSETTKPVTESWAYTHSRIKKYDFTWTVDCFSKRYDQVAEGLASPVFPVDSSEDQKWFLRLYPEGCAENSKGHLSLFLQPVAFTKQIRMKCVVSILNKHRNKTKTASWRHIFTNNTGWGWCKFIPKSFLLDNAEILLFDDKLTLFCEVSVFTDLNNVWDQNVSIKVPECHCCEEFGKLLERHELSDVTLSSDDGCDFPVHKAILAARSPVFSEIFANEMKGIPMNRIEIMNMNQEMMRDMLHYIYTGNISNIEVGAVDLLFAAEVFRLDRLKGMCEDHLCKNLTVADAAYVLAVADVLNAEILKAGAIDFIAMHATDVMETAGWLEINQKYPTLLAEVCRGMASRLKKFIG